MGLLAARVLRFAGRSLRVLLCALAAHALAYGSFVPHDHVHGYIGIYAAAVGGLSTLALGVIAVSLAALMTGRARLLRIVVGCTESMGSASARAATLAIAALAVLAVQEIVERSFAADPTEPAGARTPMWLLAIAAVVVVAALLVLLERSCGTLIRALLAGGRTLPRAPLRQPAPLRAFRHERRRNSLADFRGLRAPPLLAG